MSRRRLLATTILASVVLATIGLAWDVARFGWRPADHEARLQADITRRVAGRARAVETTAARVARSADLIAAAAASRERLPELFARLSDPGAAGVDAVTATVWLPSGPAHSYRPLAWTEGPAENIAPVFLEQAPGLFVASGTTGLRLVFVQPIESGGRRVGVATAETPLAAPSPDATLAEQYFMSSPGGPVQVRPVGDRPPAPGRFTVSSPAGSPLLEITAPPAQVAEAQRIFRWRIAAVALLPWAGLLLLLLSSCVDRRRTSPSGSTWAWLTATIAIVALACAIGAGFVLGQAGIAPVWRTAAFALAALALAALGPADAWWRTRPRRVSARSAVRFFAEHLLGGVVLAAGFLATRSLWRSGVGPPSIEQWHLPVLPSTFSAAVGLSSLLLLQIAVSWTTAGVIGMLAARWRLSWRQPLGWLAAVAWVVPTVVVLVRTGAAEAWSMAGAVTIAASAVSFGLIANSLRRHYRHTSEARRLVLQFCALAAPILAAYPLAAASADRTARDVIEREYGPATQAAQQPEMLMRILTSAWSDIDAITDLPAMLRQPGGANSSQLAFGAWSRTVLSRERVTSQIELYGPTGAMVSRFSLNVPEFGSFERSSQQMWPGSGCEWDAFAGGARFGADERQMLYSERGLCGPGGEFLGAVVIRIIPDYRTLPFVTSANPYYDALGRNDPSRAESRVPELQVVVYGWSLRPLFVSGRVIWPLDAELSDRLYQSRESFWVDRPADDRTYHLYFLNDRGGIYALGYPEPTPLQHATRLSESAALLVLLFVLYLGITVVAAPLAHRGMPPLGRLFAEIRASFYRKLFLFFVVAAVGPVVLFAVAFGTYMTAKLRAEVVSEASSVVLMARRVLDELSAAQAPAGQTRLAPNDDDMVLIRQVVDQDVNLFEGPELRATSQRDLFDSGLLPTRTPALVYREVALDRRPVFVVEDRIGTFRYLVAAAPVTWLSREALLTVPLASRQREIERQIDELTRGVLTGAVVLVLFAAALGASVAARVSDPVARLTRATRLIAAGKFDEHLAADTADELGRLVEDFNTMTEMLVAQRAELARANQLKAWAEMARQVAHEIKNPLTPIQLAAEHLQRVHEDASRPLGPVVDSCLRTILKQVRLLRQIASEFSTFAGTPTPRIETVSIAALIDALVEPYRTSLPAHTRVTTDIERGLPEIQSDRTLLSRALTNLVENAFQAMPNGGSLAVSAARADGAIEIHISDTGVGMDEEGVRRAFEPYFSTKTAGSGLGLANARRNIEICGGTIALGSRPGRGTTVTVSLPLARPAGPAPEPPASPRTRTADTHTP